MHRSELLTILSSRLDREAEGQGLVEYGLVIVLVSIASVLTLTVLGTSVSALFGQITAAF